MVAKSDAQRFLDDGFLVPLHRFSYKDRTARNAVEFIAELETNVSPLSFSVKRGISLQDLIGLGNCSSRLTDYVDRHGHYVTRGSVVHFVPAILRESLGKTAKQQAELIRRLRRECEVENWGSQLFGSPEIIVGISLTCNLLGGSTVPNIRQFAATDRALCGKGRLVIGGLQPVDDPQLDCNFLSKEHKDESTGCFFILVREGR